MTAGTGKRALVVGAGSGIGRAVHDAFVAEGAAVGVLERDCREVPSSLRRTLPSTVVVTGDATSLADNDAAVGAVVEQPRRPRRAGRLRRRLRLLPRRPRPRAPTSCVAAFDEMFHVNVASMLVSVQAALAALAASAGRSS